jgi:hypothetical protein
MKNETENVISKRFKTIQVSVEGYRHSKQAACEKFFFPEFYRQQELGVFQIRVIGDVGNAIKLKGIIEMIGKNQNSK